MHTSWTFLTNHAHVLLLIVRDPDLRIRDLAELIGITERAAQRIVSELTSEGYLEVTKDGRRNHYAVRPDLPLRHPVESDATVADLMQIAPATRRP